MSDLDILRSIGVHGGDCLEMMRAMPSDSVDSVVCDPPYGISFMGKAWDTFNIANHERQAYKGANRDAGGAMNAGTYDLSPKAALAFQRFTMEWCAEALRVLKPGGHLVSFCSTRMFHRMGVGVEDAGFEIRDTLHWCYWSGFPKSLDLGGGNGTAVKPAIEPAVLARKPLSESSIARNVLKWGTGGLNIDGCRFRLGDPMWPGPDARKHNSQSEPTADGVTWGGVLNASMWDRQNMLDRGRFPANLLYCPKASRAERELGCEGLPSKGGFEINGRDPEGTGHLSPRAGVARLTSTVRNHHPTVKPVRLMRYLCRLVTPPGGTVLDPFSGSGTCGVASALEGFEHIGAELEAEYVAIARSRIAHAKAYPTSWAHTAPGFVGDASDEVEQALRAGQMGLFAGGGMMGNAETSEQEEDETQGQEEGEEVDARRTHRESVDSAERGQQGGVGARDGEGGQRGMRGATTKYIWCYQELEEEAQGEEEGLNADVTAALAKLDVAARGIDDAMDEVVRLCADDDLEGALKVSEEAAQLVSSLVGTGGGEA